jgi:FkbM family methyltransferase
MPTTLKFLNVFKHEVDLVLYVGANRGQMVQTYLGVFPGIPIILYEPDSRLASDLSKLFEKNPNVSIKPFAVGDANEKKSFYVSSGTDGQSSSLLKMGQRHLDWSPESKQDREETVNVVRLEDEGYSGFKNIFLKIDVQGYEMEALSGIGSLFKNLIAIDSEVSFETLYEADSNWLEVCKYIEERGFRTYQIDPWFHDHTHKNELIQADIRFVRQDLIG